jgi:hypothetical protein
MVTGGLGREPRFSAVGGQAMRKCGEIAAGYQTVSDILSPNINLCGICVPSFIF